MLTSLVSRRKRGDGESYVPLVDLFDLYLHEAEIGNKFSIVKKKDRTLNRWNFKETSPVIISFDQEVHC